MGTWGVSQGGTQDTFFWQGQLQTERVKTPSPSTPVQHKLLLEEHLGFCHGRPKEPDRSDPGQSEDSAQDAISVTIPCGRKVSWVKSLKNLDYETDVNSGEF